MTSSLPPLAQALSGALGSAAANSITYPLDLVATKLQTTSSRSRRLHGLRGVFYILRNVLRTEGLTGLYDGLGADTASTLISNFLYYYIYTLLHAIAARRRAASDVPLLQALRRALLSPTPPILLSVPTELAIGYVAGVASRAVSTPLSVVTVRLQTGSSDEAESDDDNGDERRALTRESVRQPTKESPRFSDIIRHIYYEQGLSGFWAGFKPTLPLCLTPALTLLLFQLLSRVHLPRRHPGPPTRLRPSALGAFLSGATANALAVAILYPLLLAKVRVQASRKGYSDGAATSMTDVWARAIKVEGWAGLYQGLTAQLVKGFVNQGVTMLVKQRIERAAVRLYSRSR
ncbi:mitochondrial carrier domain-containing protein [Trametes punicea]|nr:mitochondrial carrier domain-containing protein [Trametes punicea]